MGAPKSLKEKERRLVKVRNALSLQVNELTSLGALNQARAVLNAMDEVQKYLQGVRLQGKK